MNTDHRSIQIALVGNPNSGKTTLFNLLTGSNQVVGNWPGVTVEKKTGALRASLCRNTSLPTHSPASLTDLPGIYSLAPYSMEERIARDALQCMPPDVIINIIDAGNLERNLYLTLQILELGIPTIIALNMMDEVRRRGDRIDEARLSRKLGVPVICVVARTGEGIEALADAAIRQGMEGNPADRKAVSGKMPVYNPAEESAYIQAADRRYQYIEKLTSEVFWHNPDPKPSFSERLDRIVTHKYLALPLFVLIMGGVFGLTFYFPGALLQKLLSNLFFEQFAPFVIGSLQRLEAPVWLLGLVRDGILGGVGGVLLFLPQIAILFGLLSLLEDSGYMARIAYIMDRPMRRLGLSGKAFVPLLMGFGCSVPAVMAARTMGTKREKRMTILLVPFISCSAKLPVYAFFAAAFFPRTSGLVILSLYSFGLLMGILVGLFLRNTAFRDNRAPFVLELPPYRLPSAGSTLRHIRTRVGHFIKKAATLIFAMSVLLWFLQSFDFRLHYVTQSHESMLKGIGSVLAPLFRPLGFGSWQAAVAILSGLVAKEAVLSSLCLFAGISAETSGLGAAAILSGIFPTAASVYSFLVFILLYVPCTATFSAMHRELESRRWTLCAVLLQFFWAYGAAWLVYHGICLFGGW